VGIAAQSVGEIRNPRDTPAPWTLAVLSAVLVIKWLLSRRVERVAVAIGSTAVRADARHHLSDALTSAAAFVGIAIAWIGGPGWEAADDWAALAASFVIAWNGWAMLRPALDELMDRTPGPDLVAVVERAARSVPGVLAIEKVALRKAGMVYRVTLHVQTEPRTPLDEAHVLGGRVKGAIMTALPDVQSVLVHMEPFEGADASSPERG
jgi:cation diffusion facilitator family transporter